MANEQNLIPQAHELTVEEASKGGKALGVNGANIQRCAAGKRKTAHGFRWKYKGTEWRYVYDGR